MITDHEVTAGYNNSSKEVCRKESSVQPALGLSESADPLGMGYSSSINILYGSKKEDFIKFHLSVSQSKFGRQYIVRGMQEGLLTKTSFLWHQPEMTEALWLAVQTR